MLAGTITAGKREIETNQSLSEDPADGSSLFGSDELSDLEDQGADVHNTSKIKARKNKREKMEFLEPLAIKKLMMIILSG